MANTSCITITTRHARRGRMSRLLKLGTGHGDLTNASALVKLLASVTPRIVKGRRNSKRIDPRDPVARTDIVSESLCDDVIQYLAPTLEQHKGCTLIDLQPGACLFSSKLHNFLKPKCHLLIEPEDHYYKPFIKPLLDKSGSTYRYTQLNILHTSSYWPEFQRIQRDPDLLPPRPPLSLDDPKRRLLDPSVLMIGNLARQPRARPSTHNVEQAPLMLYSIGYHALANQYFHDAGLIRMLWWLPEVHKPAIFPDLPHRRSGLSVGLDMALEMSEVVSVQPTEALGRGANGPYSPRFRSDMLDKANSMDVVQRMDQANIIVPDARQLQTSKLPSFDPKYCNKMLSPLTHIAGSASKLRSKIQAMSTRMKQNFPWTRFFALGKHSDVSTLEYPQTANLVDEYNLRTTHRLVPSLTTFLLDLALQLINIEASFKTLEDGCQDQTSLVDLRESVVAVETEFDELLTTQSKRAGVAVQELLEDQIAFFTSPRLTSWYRRSYEPLKAETSDFWPQQDLTLLDMVPKPRDLSVPGLADNRESVRLCAEMLQVFLNSTGLSLPEALDRVAVNAAKDLIPMVPAITDPRKGGRLNPEKLRVRMVTEEMVEGLVKAFFEWPFRPQSWEVALANSDGRGEDDSDSAEKAAA